MKLSLVMMSILACVVASGCGSDSKSGAAGGGGQSQKAYLVTTDPNEKMVAKSTYSSAPQSETVEADLKAVTGFEEFTTDYSFDANTRTVTGIGTEPLIVDHEGKATSSSSANEKIVTFAGCQIRYFTESKFHAIDSSSFEMTYKELSTLKAVGAADSCRKILAEIKENLKNNPNRYIVVMKTMVNNQSDDVEKFVEVLVDALHIAVKYRLVNDDRLEELTAFELTYPRFYGRKR